MRSGSPGTSARPGACPDVALVTIPDATHFMIVEQPGWIAERILELAGVEARA